MGKDNSFVFEILLCFSSKMLLNSLDPQIYEAVFSKATDNLLAGDAVKAKAILKIRAALFNKLSPISAYEKEMYQRCNASQTDVMRTQAIWLTKGLFLRAGFFKLNTWIQLLQRWLCELDPTMVNLLADEISEILITPNESDEYSFFDYNESAISLMRQKLFLISKQGLVDAYNKDLNKAAQMKILISQLPHIPKFLLREEMLSFIPLLINALKGQNGTNADQLIFSTLVALDELMQQDAKNFAEILPNFLTVWLDLGTGKITCDTDSKINMKIRIKALSCVQNCVNCLEPKDVILLRKEVVKKLSSGIDDHKRLVRKAAANARNSWCMAN